MLTLARLLVAHMVAALLSCEARAAEFDIIHPPGTQFAIVIMKEAIVEGDADKFEAVIGSIEKATVMLSGPGGSVAEALRIGAFIRSHSFATMVLPDQQCYSACALIWISAFRRYLAKTSLIGFHAAWT